VHIKYLFIFGGENGQNHDFEEKTISATSSIYSLALMGSQTLEVGHTCQNPFQICLWHSYHIPTNKEITSLL